MEGPGRGPARRLRGQPRRPLLPARQAPGPVRVHRRPAQAPGRGPHSARHCPGEGHQRRGADHHRQGSPWVSVPKLEKLPEPRNLGALKAEVERRWGTIVLLDILKDTAFIKGLLRHGTDAEIEANYTDTHGASLVGSAFTELLGFRLLPRLKNIGAIQLYAPEASLMAWPRLEKILKKRPIDWELIARNYDQMVRYATALRLRTAETDQVLRRFTQGRRPQAPGLPRPGGAPLFWSHVNPYGRFRLDMDTRLDLTAA